MSSIDEEQVNPYELLAVPMSATDAEISTAYRQGSRKVHPDRNRGNPDAARQFHAFNQAYELLLDPLRRLALDAKLRVKEQRQARYANYDAKRKDMVRELEERELAFKKAKTEKMKEERNMAQEAERIKEEGRRMREEREKELKEREEEAEKIAQKEREENEPPALGALDTTIRLKYPLSTHPTLTTPSALADFLSRTFGPVDSDSIVIRSNPPKNAPHKPPKKATALVPFKKLGDAFKVLCAAGRKDKGLGDVDVGWAGGQEPPVLAWLRKRGMLGSGGGEDSASGGGEDKSPEGNRSNGTASLPPRTEQIFSTGSTKSSAYPDFSSTPSFSFSVADATTPTPVSKAAPPPPSVDFESVTLMRLRQAERERIEREIREQEENE